MGRIKIHPLVDQANHLALEVQAAEQAAMGRAICCDTRDALFHRLRRNQDELGVLKEKIDAERDTVTEFERARIDDTLLGLNQKIIRLYGKIHSLAVDKEVDDIAKEAEDLEKTLEKGDVDKIKRAFSKLDEHIQIFIEQHALGKEGRETMATARATRQKAYSYLRTHGLREDRPHLMNQFNLLELVVPPYEPMQDDETMAETVLELYEVAEFFFHAKEKEGLKRFHQLATDVKNRFRVHLRILGEPSCDPLSSPKKTASALVATAYDLAGTHDGQPYLSEKQLHDLFSK